MTFDAKFGDTFFDSVPDEAGVYRFWDSRGRVIYVGKATSLRRRLGGYRRVSRAGARRRRNERKMARIVRAASSLDFEVLTDGGSARIRELELIRELNPKFNVEGTYSHLYPAIGFGRYVPDSVVGEGCAVSGGFGVSGQQRSRVLLLVLTTEPDNYDDLNLQWFGKFRSRARSKEAFSALVDLLAMLGHREKFSDLVETKPLLGSRIVGLRQISASFDVLLADFLGGVSAELVSVLARSLLEKAAARRDSEQVEELLLCLANYFRTDLKRLAEALSKHGIDGTYVESDEVDVVLSV